MTLYAHDAQMCRQCGGLCCQGHAGVWVDPQRFTQLFGNGHVLDTRSLPEGIVLRDLGGVAVPSPLTLEYGCFFLAEDGCRLEESRRPCQCLALTPHLDTLLEGEMRCNLPAECGSHTARKNWQRYWEQHKP